MFHDHEYGTPPLLGLSRKLELLDPFKHLLGETNTTSFVICNNLRHLTVELLGFPVSLFHVGSVHDCHRTFVAFQEHVQQGDLQQKRAAIGPLLLGPGQALSATSVRAAESVRDAMSLRKDERLWDLHLPGPN